MPTYFFDLQVGKVTIRDRDGRELGDDQAARLYAVQNIRDLLNSHTGKSLNTAESAVQVKGADGEVRFEVPFFLARDKGRT
jgi:hypothetical protein